MKATIITITVRSEPFLEWLEQSIMSQYSGRWPEWIEWIVVGSAELIPKSVSKVVAPKLNPWQGHGRFTVCDWWAISSARNTGIVHASGEWVIFLDDRCSVRGDWLKIIHSIVYGDKKVVAGTYSKVRYSCGKWQRDLDGRIAHHNSLERKRCHHEWTYGCHIVAPIDWVVSVNGFDERCDSMGMEDCLFGHMIGNAYNETYFDPNLMVELERSDTPLRSIIRCEDPVINGKHMSNHIIDNFRTLKEADRSLFDVAASKNLHDLGMTWNFHPSENRKTHWYTGQFLSDLK